MNKTALITGGSHNIGQGIAIVLAEHGYDVAITYNSRKEGAIETQQEIEKLGRKCFIYQASLEKAEVPQQIVDQAHKDLGRLDLMVCNAGNGGFRGSILTITPENVDEVYTVNFRNYMLCAGAAARHMVADKIEGNIIFITSSRRNGLSGRLSLRRLQGLRQARDRVHGAGSFFLQHPRQLRRPRRDLDAQEPRDALSLRQGIHPAAPRRHAA